MDNDFEKRIAREKLIKARASLDAFEYIRLMREKSTESLKLEPDGNLVINGIEGEPILNDAKTVLNLTPEEMIGYMLNLAAEVKKLLVQ